MTQVIGIVHYTLKKFNLDFMINTTFVEKFGKTIVFIKFIY